jgi:hypothetical protein
MTEPRMKLVDGELAELTAADLAQIEADESAGLVLAKAEKADLVQAEANRRVMNALPDMELAQSIRTYQAQLVSTINSKLKLHTLAAVDITTGWPE